MTKSSGRQDSVREPQQLRSQQRVQQILDASKQLIAEKGCAALKMSDIASTADISIGSIYQYFPNKQAIVAALARHYQDVFREDAVRVLHETPNDIDALWLNAMQLYDADYRLHREDPVLRDICMGAATDKTLQDINEQDRIQKVELFFELSSHLFKPSQREKVKQMLLLFIDFGQAAIDRSANLSDEEAEQHMQLSKELLSSCWEGSVRPLAIAKRRP